MNHSAGKPVFVTGAPRFEDATDVPFSETTSASTSAMGDGRTTPRVRFWKRPRVWKTFVSAWLFYHVFGLIVSPASISPSSDLQRDLWLVVGPYLQFISMNQGNHFFAPDPGPSTLVRYVARLEDGREVTGQFPDRRYQKPRLLYHRHFMLTEQLAGLADAEEFDEGLSKHLLELHKRAIARQVCLDHGATSVTLTRVTHLLREPAWAQAGMPLQHPENYEEAPLGQYAWADLQR